MSNPSDPSRPSADPADPQHPEAAPASDQPASDQPAYGGPSYHTPQYGAPAYGLPDDAVEPEERDAPQSSQAPAGSSDQPPPPSGPTYGGTEPTQPFGQPYAQPASPSYGQPPTGPAYGQPAYGETQQPIQQPTQPYGQPPTGPAYGQPPQPAYGQPAQPGQPYGQPGQPYGQPGFPPPYGQSGYPGYGDSGAAPASRALGITSAVLGLFGCFGLTAIVSIILGIVTLVRSRDGRNHGKGWAITGIVLSVLWLLGFVALVVLGLAVGSTYSSINDLTPGTCISASGLADTGDSVSSIKKVSCSSGHEGEVLATHTLSSSEAAGYGNAAAAQLCQSAVSSAGKIDVITGNVHLIGLTQSLSPDSGAKLACVAFSSDGTPLTAPLG